MNLETHNYSVFHDEYSEWIILEPIVKHENTVIFLHENNGRADKFFHEWANQNMVPPTTRVLLPQAPYSKRSRYPYTWEFQWFNKLGRIGPNYFGPSLTVNDKDKLFDQAELKEMASVYHMLIEKERMLFAPGKQTTRRIYLGGFDEGGMMSMATFLRYEGTEPLGGIFALSSL